MNSKRQGRLLCLGLIPIIKQDVGWILFVVCLHPTVFEGYYIRILRMNRLFLNKNKPLLVLNRRDRNQSQVGGHQGISAGISVIPLLKKPSKNGEQFGNGFYSCKSQANIVVLQYIKKFIPQKPRSNSISLGENITAIKLKKASNLVNFHARDRTQSIRNRQLRAPLHLDNINPLKQNCNPNRQKQLRLTLNNDSSKWKLQYNSFHKEISRQPSGGTDDGVQFSQPVAQAAPQQRNMAIAIKQINLKFSYHRKKTLAIEQKVCDLQVVQSQQCKIDGNLTKEQVKVLTQKSKRLHEEVQNRQRNLRILMQRSSEMEVELANKTALLSSYDTKIKEESQHMKKVDDCAKQLDLFLINQPDKILKMIVTEYKQIEQSLFDLAEQMQIRTPECLRRWAHEAIVLPRTSFQYSVQHFPSSYHSKNEQYIIASEQLQSFRKSISNSFGLCLSTLMKELESKINHIKEFVRLMSKVAQYTVGKREYLNGINKKMTVTSVATEEAFTKLQKQLNCIQSDIERKNTLSMVEELKELCNGLKMVYHQAEVFY